MTTTQPATPTPQPDTGRSARRWTLIAMSLGFAVVQLDVSVVNVAIKSIGSALGGGVSALQWVVNAYTIGFAAFILTASLPVRQSTEGYLETIPEIVVEVRSKNDTGREDFRCVSLFSPFSSFPPQSWPSRLSASGGAPTERPLRTSAW